MHYSRPKQATRTPTLLNAVILSCLSSPAWAMEFGLLRPLQYGPIGDSPQFVDIDRFAGEAALTTSRIWGDTLVNSDTDRKVEATGFKMRVATGGGWAPSKEFTLTGYADFTLASDYDEEQTRSSKQSTLDAGLYRHEVAFFGTYRKEPLLVGGGLGVLIIGGEDREFVFDNNGAKSKYYQSTTAATMPVLRLFGGVGTKHFDGTVGIRVFAKGDSTVDARDKQDGTKITEYDVIRRNPGEIHADGKLKFSQASVAGSFSYLLTNQGSEQVDEWSTVYAASGKIRQTGGYARHNDQFRAGIGGRFDPNKMLGLMGGLTYLSSYYAKESYAVVESENLGGFRLDVGGQVTVGKFNGSFQTGYQVESSASATIDDDSRSEAALAQSQRYPVAKGEKIAVKQGRWDIGITGGIAL